ncbi:MAG: DUF4224 domain-containing protein [Candidatus Sedimenticola sp. 6PFRAG5]
MFLDRTELQQLTGYVRPSGHIRWLAFNDYPFEIGRDGYPRVLTSFVEKRMGGLLPEKRTRNRPHFEAIGGR